MVTHAKNNIVKPHIIHSLWFHIHLTVKEPRGFKSTIKHPEWPFVMDNEIAALK
jgi:hypothetical protein